MQPNALIIASIGFFGTIIGATIGVVATLASNSYNKRQERETVLHSLYVEIEENLTFLCNVKKTTAETCGLELRRLNLEAYSQAKLSRAFWEIRGEILQAVQTYFLKAEDFNTKVAFCNEPFIKYDYNICIEDLKKYTAIAQHLMLKYLIEKRIMPVQKKYFKKRGGIYE